MCYFIGLFYARLFLSFGGVALFIRSDVQFCCLFCVACDFVAASSSSAKKVDFVPFSGWLIALILLVCVKQVYSNDIDDEEERETPSTAHNTYNMYKLIRYCQIKRLEKEANAHLRENYYFERRKKWTSERERTIGWNVKWRDHCDNRCVSVTLFVWIFRGWIFVHMAFHVPPIYYNIKTCSLRL